MQRKPTDVPLRGAVDLSALARPPAGPTGGRASAPAGGGATVIDVTEDTFQAEVLERSLQVPVILDFWASWCGPCRQLSPILERLAGEGGGSWVLGKVDCDANPRLAQAAGVQGIPAVKAVIGGQIVGEFTGAVPEPQAREFIDAVVDAAAGAGLGGQSPGDEAPAAPTVPGEVAEAEAALDRGDLDAAAAAYQRLLRDQPGSADAQSGLAYVELLRRIADVSPDAAYAAANAAPDDVEAAARASDLDVVEGRAQDAFDRLIELVRRSSGADRDRTREHLLSLFAVLPADDPLVATARRNLSAALF